MTLFHHVVDRGVIKRRCNGQRRRYPLSSLLDGYQCARQDEHTSYGASPAAVPPFGCTFSSAPGQQSSLAVANEEGFVTIFNTGEKQSSVLKAVFSTGGRDGNIMIWDTRCSKKGSCTRKLGYSGLSLDSTGSRLFSNCTDDNIYMFDISGLKTTPVAVFSGHSNSSFYVKSSVSPDDQFLASGSSDHHAYIWKIPDPKQAPMMLQGHSQEVTSVAWCPSDFTKIASCSDDNTVRIWRLNRRPDGENSSNRDPNLVGWTLRKIQSPPRAPGPYSPVEITPAKSSGCERAVSLASPQPAACAPMGADLPLPSNTSAPSAKVSSPKMPSSIQQWISRGTSPLRKVLTPVLQGPSSERRAKRRLETGDGSGLGEESDGVSELYPDVKRSRSSVSAQNEKGDLFSLQTEERLSSAGQAGTGKENSSPRRTDWLSVISQRFKGSAQPKSPNGGSKRHDARTHSSPAAVSPCPIRVVSSPPTKKASPSRPTKKISCYFVKRTQD
uniref:Denticleless protein homolog n=1 Tax=Sinocyclocheilus anshuiensis TaxID=1608454 RepID=A0A671Q3U7_9TELE